MNEDQLDLLLSQNDILEGELFTTKLMNSLPEPGESKKRLSILLSAMGLGLVISFFLLPKSSELAIVFQNLFDLNHLVLFFSIVGATSLIAFCAWGLSESMTEDF